MHTTRTRRLFTSLITALLLFAMIFNLSACNTSKDIASQASQTYELTILATNDLHGHIEALPQYLTIINQVREEREHVLLLDAGDIFRRGPYSDYQGRVEIELFNQMGYNAIVLGNNEFKVSYYSPDSKRGSGTLEEADAQIADIIKWADFPVLCGNVTLKNSGAYIDGVQPYIIEKLGDLNIGIIGITHMQPVKRKLDMAVDKNFIRGDLAVKQLLPEVQQLSDIQIVLSHASFFVDRRIRSVSAVIGGHDHFRLNNYKNMYGVYITQGGGVEKHRLVQLDLTFVLIENEWVIQTAVRQLHKADGVPYNPALIIPDPPIN